MVTLAVQSKVGYSNLLDAIGHPVDYAQFFRSNKIPETTSWKYADIKFALHELKADSYAPNEDTSKLANKQLEGVAIDVQSAKDKADDRLEKSDVVNHPAEHELQKFWFHVTDGYHYSSFGDFVLNGTITQIGDTEVEKAAQIKCNTEKRAGVVHMPKGLLAYVRQKEFYEGQKREQMAAQPAAATQTSPKTGLKPHTRRKT